MTVNASFQYQQAELAYLNAKTTDEKINALKLMLTLCPKHKGSENLKANLSTRYKKLKEKLKKNKKSKKGKGKPGIKKEDLQAVLVGLTNSGRSSILKSITNAQPRIASYGFTTTQPEIGTLNYANCNIQIVDLPPIASENFDKGIANNTEVLLVIVEKIHEIHWNRCQH